MGLSLHYGYAAESAADYAEIYGRLQSEKAAGNLGFTKLPFQDEAALAPLLHLADQVASECKNLVVIGIGGSDLGARAVHRALNHQFYNVLESVRKGRPRLFFLGDTTDPLAIKEVLDVVDLNETVWAVISKSGNTVEQMSTFAYVRSLVKQAVAPEHVAHKFIILTDAEKGTLREIVKREGYRSLVVPGDVGGRFSVFSTVGLFPLAVSGVNVRGLLAGAKAAEEHDSSGPQGNLPLLYAALQIEAYQAGKPISVFMPYSYGLREVGFWFRQLWAESLGKKLALDGSQVNVGPTPIAAVGPTDQHSQVQLYMEGPADKMFTFVTVKDPAVNMELPESFHDLEGTSYLKGHSFAEILQAEYESTAYALAGEGRPSCTLEMEKLDTYHVGQLLQTLELAVSYAGLMLKVNTYDQPGVEIGKEYMYGLLGRPGFEDRKLEKGEDKFVSI